MNREVTLYRMIAKTLRERGEPKDLADAYGRHAVALVRHYHRFGLEPPSVLDILSSYNQSGNWSLPTMTSKLNRRYKKKSREPIDE